ncbi:MAG: hypothetical protein E6I47_07335 [Chloroflexi bacterium]|nr:MAG: hypothetical protein E6I47_07335 [Chloroflexota bacterium]
MNAALFTKSTTGLILASGLIAASSVLGHAQDAPVALGTLATYPLSSAYATVPTGQATLGGHTFDMTSGNMVKLATNASASFAGSYQNPTAVHLLLNSANTYSWYDGTPVGTVVLTFSDGTTQTATLTVGSNLREWSLGGFGVVNSVTDVTPSTTTPYSTQVWTTTVLGGTGTAVLDMLTVPVVTANTTLTSVQVTNNNPFGGALSIDLSGLTVELGAAPVPTPQPQDCTRPGNSCNTPAADNSQAWKWQAPAPGATVTNPNAKSTASATIKHKSH